MSPEQFAVEFTDSAHKKGAKFPLIKVKVNDRICSFLLDTGANVNIINEKVFDEINQDGTFKLDKSEGIITGKGMMESPGTTTLSFKYRTKKFEQEFDVIDMSEAFNGIKEDTGINIDGILGDGFFQEYQWVIDFEKLVTWVR